MATITPTRPELDRAPERVLDEAPRQARGWFWAALTVLVVAALVVVAFTVWPFVPQADVSLDWAGTYYWEDIGQEALARNAVTVQADTFYVDGLDVRAAEAAALRLEAAGGPTGYYWEDITRQALLRAQPLPTPAEVLLEDLSG